MRHDSHLGSDPHIECAPTPPSHLYVWQVFDADERWGTIAVATPAFGGAVTPLIFRDRSVAENAEPFARAHGRAAGKPVRLVRFDQAAILVWR